MVDISGNGINRHRTIAVIRNVNLHDHLIYSRRRHIQGTIDVRRGLMHEIRRKGRERAEIVGKRPTFQRASLRRYKHTGNHVRLIAILCPRFLVTEHLIVYRSILIVDLFIEDRLLSDVREDRIVKRKTSRPGEHFRQALRVRVIRTNTAHTDNVTMFHERLIERAAGKAFRRGNTAARR